MSKRKNQLFYEYYMEWIKVYKEGAIRDVTLKKYYLTQQWVKKLLPNTTVGELSRIVYQQLLNELCQRT